MWLVADNNAKMGAILCGRCAGALVADYLDLADAVCILCGERYIGQERFARKASEDERIRLKGRETSEQRLRSAARRVKAPSG